MPPLIQSNLVPRMNPRTVLRAASSEQRVVLACIICFSHSSLDGGYPSHHPLTLKFWYDVRLLLCVVRHDLPPSLPSKPHHPLPGGRLFPSITLRVNWGIGILVDWEVHGGRG